MFIDFNHIKKNIEENKYSLIGAGTGRNVFDCNNGYVIKAAKNNKGIAQNKAERHISSLDQSHVFAKTLAMSEDARYLIMEKAENIRSLKEVWDYYHVRNGRELFRSDNFNDFTEKYDLLYPDLYRRTSWGIVNGKPVIIDFGYTKETRKYYTQFL
jgi:hypothetical protein